MSAWRRKAIALFPEHRNHFTGPETTLPTVYSELLGVAIDAHAKEDTTPHASDQLRRIHGFAEWCLHEEGELWSAAAIGFYEDLLAVADWEKVVPWLSPFVVKQVEDTWALGVKRQHAPRFERLVADRRRHAYRDHVYSTGEVQAL